MPGARPLGEDRHRLARLAEADEAAIDVRRPRRLLDRDLEELVEVAPRPEGERDAGDQALSLERVGERRRGAGPLQGESRLGREGLHQRQLALVEERGARASRRRRRR